MKRSRLLPSLVIGATLVSALVLMSLLSLVWTPHSATIVNVNNRLLPPGTEGHMLGTDFLGRDVVSQIMVGSRNSLLVSVLSTLATVIPGVLLGLAVAVTNGLVRSILARAIDVALALPGILIALVIATVIGAGNAAVMIAIVAWFIPIIARTVMGPAEQVLALDFVAAASAYGRSKSFIAFRHVLPNISSLVIVLTSLMFAAAFLVEAALAYLGIGAQRPTPAWGRMLNETQRFVAVAPLSSLAPGIAIMLAVLGFNLLGDGLRSLLDPQQRLTRGTKL